MKNEHLKTTLSRLAEMKLSELRIFWKQQFHSKPPGLSRVFLRKQIAFLLQEQAYGGYSEFITEQVMRIGKKRKRAFNSKGFEVGKVISRYWRGREYCLIAVEDGFRMDNKFYRSLSGAAFAVTGANWNGKVFWRVK